MTQEGGIVLGAFDLSILTGEQARRFGEYLHAALRRLGVTQSQAGFEKSGCFSQTLHAPLGFGEASIPVVWRLEWSEDGGLRSLVVTTQATQGNGLESAVSEFYQGVLLSALAEQTSDHVVRTPFHYMGAPMRGEYWLGGMRVGPVLQDGPSRVPNAEHIVCVDQTVAAVDSTGASDLGYGRARRLVSRIGLIANVGFFSPTSELRWVLDEDGSAVRRRLGYPLGRETPRTMPTKGQLVPVAEFKNAEELEPMEAVMSLYLPRYTRPILRYLDGRPQVARAFDACAGLWQVGLIVRRMFPSAGLAYQVSAIEALGSFLPMRQSFSEFLRTWGPKRLVSETLLDFLYRRARSAHLHGGEFPLGDLETLEWDFSTPEAMDRLGASMMGPRVLREALDSWMLGVLAADTATVGEDSG